MQKGKETRLLVCFCTATDCARKKRRHPLTSLSLGFSLTLARFLGHQLLPPCFFSPSLLSMRMPCVVRVLMYCAAALRRQ